MTPPTPPNDRLARLRMEFRDPKVRADIRRQVKMMAQHPENDAIDDWIEAIYDWDDFGDPPPS